MFLNVGILKKLMKEAYKGGLRVGKNAESTYIAGSYWEFEILDKFLAKQIKAQIIELAGELPEVGEMFSATKTGNQMETAYHKNVDKDPRMMREITVTPFVIDHGSCALRILQDDEGKIFTVNNVFIRIQDDSEIDMQGGETNSILRQDINGMTICIYNNVGAFRAYLRDEKKYSEILKQMRSINLSPLSEYEAE